MSDPLTLGLASTAVSLVNGTISIFKQVNESAKKSDDLELKQGLNDLYGQFVEIKAQVLDLAQENSDLKRKLSIRENVKRDFKTGFYYLADDPGPLCPACWDLNAKAIHLDAPMARVAPDKWTRMMRECKVCKNVYLEPKDDLTS